VLVEWAEAGNGGGEGASEGNSERRTAAEDRARLRSRSLRVEVADDLLAALRGLLGPDHVHLVRTT
jgi:hypothetical protein